MRWIRLLVALIRARFRSKINAADTISLTFRVWFTEIDVSVMNHAEILTIMETGRVDFMVRTNFMKVATNNKWVFPSQSITVQYYRPLKMFQKAQLFTRISYADEKWIYMEQKIMRKGREVAACLVKSTVKKGRETIPVSEIMKALNIDTIPDEKYKLIEIYEQENLQFNERIINSWKI